MSVVTLHVLKFETLKATLASEKEQHFPQALHVVDKQHHWDRIFPIMFYMHHAELCGEIDICVCGSKLSSIYLLICTHILCVPCLIVCTIAHSACVHTGLTCIHLLKLSLACTVLHSKLKGMEGGGGEL